MQPRMNPYQVAPEAMKAMGALENYVQTRGLEASLIDLVKTRAFTDQRMCVLHPHPHA